MFERYAQARADVDAHNAWVDTIRNKRTGWASYDPHEVPAPLQHVNNDLRALVEVFEWLSAPPDRYFLYIKESPEPWGRWIATNWTGHKLGDVTQGGAYRDNLGGLRVPVRVWGTNGRAYVGTYFKSAGNYARVRYSAPLTRGMSPVSFE